MGKDQISRCRMKDGSVSASYVMDPEDGGLQRLILAVVPGFGGGPPRILFVRVEDSSSEFGRSVLLPWGATKAPPIEWLCCSMQIDEEDSQILCRFLDAELRSLMLPSPDPRDTSVDGDYDPVTETDEVELEPDQGG